MSRPLRIEFPNAIYHVTSRGDRREPIYRDDFDRRAHIGVIAQAMDRFDAQVLAFCQMGNHYHLVLHTRAANLSRLMRHVNGVYTQAYNRRHVQVGHLFQGRFKAILVDRDAYLLALCRYVERNPVAAGLVARAADWPWSSYQAHIGQVSTPDWLDSAGLHGYLLGRPVANTRDSASAAARYAALVDRAQPQDATFWQQAISAQVFLGDAAFVEKMQAQADPKRLSALAIPRGQRGVPGTWPQFLAASDDQRNPALCAAYRSGHFTMSALAALTRLSVSHVSRLVAAGERAADGEAVSKEKGET